MTMTTSCNLMNPVNQEDDLVDVLKNSSKGEKLKIIQNLVRNMQNLATALDDSRPDLANAIDNVLQGQSSNLKKANVRTLSTIYGGNVFTLDSVDGSISRALLKVGKPIMDVRPITLRDARKSVRRTD